MRASHQGVAGASAAGTTSGLFGAGLLPSFARPSAAMPNPEAEVRPTPAGGGIDTWLIDRLFGRR